MTESNRHRIFEDVAASIEIPDSSYELAEARYKDLGVWLGRPESSCGEYDPHISAQGSFRLGTVNRPLSEKAAYDLDLSCNLEGGLTMGNVTQEGLKSLVGSEVEGYRQARKITEPLREKHRCWRLAYADKLTFHMDIVPCIPAELVSRRSIGDAMLKAGSDLALVQQVAGLTVSITDDRHPLYRQISSDWKVSNPQGYARWFESRMRLATTLLEKRVAEARAATIDDLPAFRWKTPLQRCVQLLKRHRDIMFRTNPDAQPISIIITTLAARAYRGEADLGDALERVLTDMGGLVSSQVPRVPNPVNPAEDFADKWSTEEGRRERLADNFDAWLAKARADFGLIWGSTDSDFISEQALKKLGLRLDSSALRAKLVIPVPAVMFSPKTHVIHDAPARPWKR
ncbi:MAG: nucleotidyltransferase [Terracidiphilus sp.]|jgi:hypothetical protein